MYVERKKFTKNTNIQTDYLNEEMSALQYFDLFDRILTDKLTELARKYNDRKKVANTVLFKEFVTYSGKLRNGLLHFIGWLISSNGKIKNIICCCY